MEKTIIPTEREAGDFNDFINTKNNNRIFFSARFGMGKTYFLKEFFEAEKDNYNVFHLYPVKYQIHNDVEILEIIGSDLFLDLLIKRKEDTQDILDKLLKNKEFKNKFLITVDIAYSLLRSFNGIRVEILDVDIASSLFRSFNGIIVGILDMANKIKKLCKKPSEKIKELAKNKVNFFEDLISKILTEMKNKDNKDEDKENILILDDLDRLEPKHIFKILNAFSPLQDEEENKFGFDKVIFVGDIDNTEKIFRHIYGSETDFAGYIDKFFSYTPYKYEIEKEIKSLIKKIVEEYSHQEGSKESMGKDGYISAVLFFILLPAIQLRKINLRNILMPQTISISEIDTDKFGRRESENAQVNYSAKILLSIFHGKEKLLDTIRTIQGENGEPFNYDNRDIRRIKTTGFHIWEESFLIENRRVLDRGGEEFKERYKKEGEEYHDHFSDKNESEGYKSAVQVFLENLYKYIEHGFYNDDYDAELEHSKALNNVNWETVKN